MTIAERATHTPQDVLRLADEGRFELVHGELVEKGMSKESNEIANIVAGELRAFLKRTTIARAYNEQPFMCFGESDDPTRVRKPDVAVVLNANVAADASDDSFFRLPPDIAIEVLSPNDRQGDRAEKLLDYERAKVPLVWIIDPDLREVTVRRPAGRIDTLRAADTLTAEPVLPGFSVKVADLFPPPMPASKAAS